LQLIAAWFGGGKSRHRSLLLRGSDEPYLGLEGEDKAVEPGDDPLTDRLERRFLEAPESEEGGYPGSPGGLGDKAGLSRCKEAAGQRQTVDLSGPVLEIDADFRPARPGGEHALLAG